jgi:hypothetical protein
VLATALRAKQSAVAAASSARGVSARPLVPIPWGIAPFAYGGTVAGSLAFALWGEPLAGAGLVVVAMMLAAHRSPLVVAKPRGPGRWETIADADVLVARPDPSSDVFDVGTRKGKIAAALVAIAIAAVAFALRLRVAGAVVAVPLCSAALVPLFVTGTRAQLPPRPSDLASRVLRGARDALARMVDLAHVEIACIARFRSGAPSDPIDEVRIACAPKDRIPGLRAIELAVAAPREGATSVAWPEILVRFDDGSEAAAKIAEVARGRRIVPGRGPEEKVLRVAPDAPTSAAAARLVAHLLGQLEERRARASAAPKREAAPWAGPERRRPRRVRAALEAAPA